MTATNDIIVAYDGSENARHAIEVAARELGPRPAEVLHVWEPLVSASSRLAIYAAIGGAADQELELEAQSAQATAEEGGRLAREVGFDATAVAVRSNGPPADAIVEYVNAHSPSLVVAGTRGLSGVRSAFAGSVSGHVTQHVVVPVLVVPPRT